MLLNINKDVEIESEESFDAKEVNINTLQDRIEECKLKDES